MRALLEECDDGNDLDGDGCRKNARQRRLATYRPTGVCKRCHRIMLSLSFLSQACACVYVHVLYTYKKRDGLDILEETHSYQHRKVLPCAYVWHGSCVEQRLEAAQRLHANG